MANYTVTTTQDTDSQLQPAPADVPASFKAALRAASADAGSTIAFSLPANSNISLLSFTYPTSVATQAGTINVDFTGAPGLTFGSSANASVPGSFTVLRDYVDMTVTGALKGDSTAGYLLSLFAPTATATLNMGASLSSASTVTALNDGGARLTIGANAAVSSTAANALVITQAYGAVTEQTVTIASGATVSSSAGSRSAVYADSSATGATITNSGTISATGNAGYVGNSNAALINTMSGVVTSNATSALQLNQASTLTNAGALTSTAVAATVYNTGTGAVTNSGVISATQGIGYNATLASTLTNASGGQITSAASANSAVVLTGGAVLNNAGSITQTATDATQAANANAVFANGSGAITNSGTISSVGNSSTTTSGGYFSAAVTNLNTSTFTNSGTISSAGGNAYAAYVLDSTVGNHTTLINNTSGVITASYAVSTVNLNSGGAATLNNAGLISNTAGGTALLNSGTGGITNSGTIQSAAAVGASSATAYYSQGANTATNTVTGLITTSGTTAVNLFTSGAAFVNAGVVSNTYSGASTAVAVRVAAGASLTNSGTVRETNAAGYTIGVSGGGTVNSTGTITSGGAYAIQGQPGGAAMATINLLAGSQTLGAVGGTTSSPLAITVAGSLTGALNGSAANADALTLVNGLSLNGNINLGGGGDTLTLTGASGSNTLIGTTILSAVALSKAGAGAWTLSGAGANYSSVALNGGVLELAAANSAGAGAISFGTNSQTLRLDLTAGANYTLANTLTGFGVEDLIDIRNTTVTATAVSGDTLTLTTAGGSTATLSFAAGTLSGKTVAAATDGAGGSYVSVGAAVAPAVVAPGQTTNLDSANSSVVNGDVTDNGVAQVGGPTPITYTGSISGTGSLTVSGGSTVMLTGNSTYTGPTTVASGTLVVNGSIANSPVMVSSGAVLGGNGTTGALTASSGSTVSPGNSPGILNTTSALVLASGAILKEEIGGVMNGANATTFDQINVTGSANISGAVLNASLYGGFTPAASGSAAFSIIHTTAGVTGTFAGLAEGATLVIGGQQATISYVGGATHTDITLQFTGPYAPPITTTPAPTLSPSQAAGYTIQTDNLLRADASDAALSNPSSPIYVQAQAEKAIAGQLDAGQIGALDAQNALYHLVDGTTSVAEISYAFFTGRTPTAAGLNYLVHSDANARDLNDPYYAQFATENRYINFAVNLATAVGAGAAQFQAAYGALSLTDATTQAYAAIFGTTPTADKIAAILNAQVSNGLGGTETRAQYFTDITGGSAASQKAAAIGFLLADSVKEGFGLYQQADLHFLADLAHGTAVFNVDLLAAYGAAPTLVGQAVLDPTLPG